MRKSALVLSLLLGSVISIPAEEPARDPKLADLINKVKEQEARYANYELVVTRKYQHLRTADVCPDDFDNITEKSSSRWRTIVQGDLRYVSRAEKGHTIDGTQTGHQIISAYDGKNTRTYRRNKLEIVNGLKSQHDSRRPHMLLLDGCRPGAMSLAEFLRQTKDDVERPMVITVEGKDEVDELECVKIKIEHWYSETDNPEFRYVWLATGRNYLPVKSIYEGARGPGEEDRVLEWSEIPPGVWMPRKIEIVANVWDAKRGAMVPMLRTDFHVTKIDLKPSYPLEFFQEIKLPEVK